jgi:putative membrane protein
MRSEPGEATPGPETGEAPERGGGGGAAPGPGAGEAATPQEAEAVVGQEAGRPRRLHPVSPVFLGLREARRLWPLALLVLARRQVWIILVAAAVVVVAVGLQWLRRTYTLGDGILLIEEGVLARKRRLLPFDRIQQVDLVRKPLHRLLGVATLRVETAGGAGGSEADLEVIALAEAERLRATLLRAKAAAVREADAPAPGARVAGAPTVAARVEASAAPSERVLVRLSLGQVALAGLTSLRGLAALAVVGYVFQLLDEAPRWLLDRLASRVDPGALAPSTAPAVAVVALRAVAVRFGLAAASSVVTDYGFVLARSGDNLVVRRGLLERREAVVPLPRVQVVRIEESLVRRWLGFASMRIQSAGQAARAEATTSRLAVPILPAVQVNRLLGELLPGAAPVPMLLGPPPAARRRAIVRRVVPVLVVVALATFLLWPWGAVAVAALPLAWLAGEAAYRNLGHARHGGFLTARRGALVRTTAVVPAAKAQSARVRSTLFQRRAGLATLHVDVAGGGPIPQVTDEAVATAERLLAGVVRRGPAAATSGPDSSR